MKVLTVRQPWSWAIARGHKDIENRRWTTTHRGTLAIHAAGSVDDRWASALRTIRRQVPKADLPDRLDDDRPCTDLGRIVAIVDLVDICRISLTGAPCDCGPWALPGHAHWRLANARPLAGPILTGRLGLWEHPIDLDHLPTQETL